MDHLKNPTLSGVWTALATPMTEGGKGIDWKAYSKLLKLQIGAGVSGVIPCGTTGESPTLSFEEKQRLIQVALEECKGSPVQVGAGTGGNCTEDTVKLSKWASDQGVAAVLIVTPYYNKPSQAGMEAHFRAVADAVRCTVIPYNVPGRTGVSLTAETAARLASHPRIRALKEATGNPAFTSEILTELEKTGYTLNILSGDDLTFLPLLAVGATGVISVASNAIPKVMNDIYTNFVNKNFDKALSLHQKHFSFFRDLFIESNPGPLKHALHILGIGLPDLRLPLVPLQPNNAKRLEATMTACGLMPGGGLR